MFSGHFGSFRVFGFFWSQSQYVFLSVAGVTWDPMHSIGCLIKPSSTRLSRRPHTVGSQPREAKNIKHGWFYPHGVARRISQQNFPANARKRLSKPPREEVCSALSLCRGLRRSLAKKGKRSLVRKLTRPTSFPNFKNVAICLWHSFRFYSLLFCYVSALLMFLVWCCSTPRCVWRAFAV